MFKFSLTTNDVQAWTRTRKSVLLRTLGGLNSISLYRCAKEGKFMLYVLKMQIALVPIQRKIKFNVVDTFIWVSVLIFCFSFFLAFFTIAIVKQLHYTNIRCYIPLHSVTSGQQSCFLGFQPTHTVYSTFFAFRLSQYLTRLEPKTLLWIVQRHEFALHIDLDRFTLLPGWITLVNLGAQWQKSQVIMTTFWPCQLFFVKWMRATGIIISDLKDGKLDIRWE